MDILHLVDRLEELLGDSRLIPFTHRLVVDEDRALEIIDQMRISIPEEVKKAQQVIAQRDRILAQAQEEASRTISLAQQKGDEFISRDAIVEAATSRAEQIIAQTKADTEDIRKEADEYVIEALGALEAELDRLLTQARNGIATLVAQREQAQRESETSQAMESFEGKEPQTKDEPVASD